MRGHGDILQVPDQALARREVDRRDALHGPADEVGGDIEVGVDDVLGGEDVADDVLLEDLRLWLSAGCWLAVGWLSAGYQLKLSAKAIS